MAPLPRPMLAVVAVVATLQMSQGFQLAPGANALSRRKECTTRLSVASQDATTATETTAKVPYSISRGDGSTGGGGLPMPNHQKVNAVEQVDDEELKRPKVGAEMPLGRPSWFRVPAPSQGKSISIA
jgi:hypothetical protein